MSEPTSKGEGWRTTPLWEAESAALIVELRSRMEDANDEDASKLGGLIISLGSDVVGMMFERNLTTFTAPDPGPAETKEQREELMREGYEETTTEGEEWPPYDDEPEDDDSPKGHWQSKSFEDNYPHEEE